MNTKDGDERIMLNCLSDFGCTSAGRVAMEIHKGAYVLQVIFAGGVGTVQISKKISTDALSIKCRHVFKDSLTRSFRIFTDPQSQGSEKL